MSQADNGASALVLHSVRVLANPSSSQADKKEAQLILTKVEQSHVSTTLGVAGELCRQKEDAVALFGYSILSGVARKRWKECTEQEKKDITQFSWKCLVKAGDVGPSKPICAAVCELFGLILTRDSQSSLLPGWKNTIDFGRNGARQFDLACRVGQVICQQSRESASHKCVLPCIERGGTTTEAKLAFRMAQRYLIKALSTIGKESIVFLFKGVDLYYQQGVQCGQAGDQQSVKVYGSIVKNALDAVSAFAEFVSVSDLEKSGAIVVFQALFPFPEFRESLMNILDQLFCRDDIENAQVAIGVKFGAIALERLERLHAKRRENRLDVSERDFEEVQKVVSTTTHFALAYAERISGDGTRLEHLLAQILSCFKFKSIEIAAISLPFWSRVLNSRALIPLNEGSRHFKRALSAIAKDLAMCLFGLHEHMKTSSGAEDCLQNHAGIEEFREEHGPQVSTCLTNFSQLFPHIIRSHIASVSMEALRACNDKPMNAANGVVLLRRLSLILEHVSMGKIIESDEIKLALSDTLEKLLTMDIGNQMELALWFGDALRSCTKAVKLNNELTLSLMTTTINMLCRLPMGTAGIGLPLVSEEKYKTYSEARMNLCLIIRSLVEQTPGPMLLHIQKFKAKVEKAKKSQRLSISEYIAFAEVAILASQSTSIDCQKDILSWSLEPLRVSWKSKTWIYRPSSEAAFGDVYLAYDINPDASTTMVGHDSRWELYHEIQLLSKVLSRCPRKKWRYAGDDSPESPVDEALDLVFVVGKITRSIQSLWEICENHTIWKNIVSMKASRNRNGVKLTELQEGLAVSDTTLESCRLWLEVLFRQCGGILGTTGSICPLFWSHEHLSQRLPSLVTESVDRTSIVLCKDLLEQVIIPWVKFCPPWKHSKWVLPALEAIPHINKKIKDGWSSLEDDQPQDVEIEMALQDHLQDTTEQFAKLLAALSLGSTDETRGTKSKSVFDKLLDERSRQCGEIIQYSLDLLSLKNWSVIEPVAQFCRCVVAASHRYKDIQEFVTTDMLPMALELLFDRNMAPVVASLILLLGEILAKYLGSDGSVAQCMMRLPGMTELKLESLAKNLMCGQKMKEHLQDTLVACCGNDMPALGLS